MVNEANQNITSMHNKILIQGGWVVDPTSQLDAMADVAIADGRIVEVGTVNASFQPEITVNANGCIVIPGLVDLSARLREPGYEHAGMLASELKAALAGGVTSLVCPPDTDPVLDEPGLIEMLRYRAQAQNGTRVFPLGALTRGLKGEVLTEMLALTEAGCIAFSQAEVPIADTQVLLRSLQYASTYGLCVWLRPQDLHLGKGVAASGPLATRMGLSGIPVAAETIALHTIFELVKSTQARVHLCRISSAEGLDLVRQAKRAGLPVTCDISINSLHLSDVDMGYFDSRMRLTPPLRQQRDRDALRAGLADGTVDALVSDHTPVEEDAKTLPFAESEPGASGLELLLSLALKWGAEQKVPLTATIDRITRGPAAILQSAAATAGLGQLKPGSPADICVFDPKASWIAQASTLKSQGKHTPFSGYEMPGVVRYTLVRGRVAYQAEVEV